MKEGGSELSSDISTKAKALKTAAGDADRALRLFNASAQAAGEAAMLLLRILNLLRKELSKAQLYRPRFQATVFNAVNRDQSCFDTMTCFCKDVLGLAQEAVVELEPPAFRRHGRDCRKPHQDGHLHRSQNLVGVCESKARHDCAQLAPRQRALGQAHTLKGGYSEARRARSDIHNGD